MLQDPENPRKRLYKIFEFYKHTSLILTSQVKSWILPESFFWGLSLQVRGLRLLAAPLESIQRLLPTRQRGKPWQTIWQHASPALILWHRGCHPRLGAMTNQSGAVAKPKRNRRWEFTWSWLFFRWESLYRYYSALFSQAADPQAERKKKFQKNMTQPDSKLDSSRSIPYDVVVGWYWGYRTWGTKREQQHKHWPIMALQIRRHVRNCHIYLQPFENSMSEVSGLSWATIDHIPWRPQRMRWGTATKRLETEFRSPILRHRCLNMVIDISFADCFTHSWGSMTWASRAAAKILWNRSLNLTTKNLRPHHC